MEDEDVEEGHSLTPRTDDDIDQRLTESFKKLQLGLIEAMQQPVQKIVSGMLSHELKLVHSRMGKVETGQQRVSEEVQGQNKINK